MMHKTMYDVGFEDGRLVGRVKWAAIGLLAGVILTFLAMKVFQ